METWKKLAIGTGVGSVLLAGTAWLLRLNRTAVNLEVIPNAKVHKIDLSAVTIRVDLQVKNPTRTSLNIKYPFVRLSYQDNSIGSSQAVDQDIVLPANGEAQIENILISIPMLNLLSSAGKVLTALQNKETVQLQIDTLTSIDLKIKKVPFSKRMLVNLNNRT